MTKHLQLLTLLMLGIGTAAQAQDDFDMDGGGAQAPRPAAAPPPAPVDVTADISGEELVDQNLDYSYAGYDLQDPFIPPLQVKQKAVSSDLEIPIVSPLQQYDVNSIRLVGVWESQGKRKAMLLTPAREGVVVVQEDPVGNKGGILYAIERDKVSVREYNFSKDGTREFIDRVIFLEGEEPEDKGVIVIKGGKVADKPAVTAPSAQPASTISSNIGTPSAPTEKLPMIEEKVDPASYSGAFGDINEAAPAEPLDSKAPSMQPGSDE